MKTIDLSSNIPELDLGIVFLLDSKEYNLLKKEFESRNLDITSKDDVEKFYQELYGDHISMTVKNKE